MGHSYCDYIVDLLSSWGSVRAQRMFGGYGIYHHDIIFGIIAEDMFYLKVDAANRPDYEAANSEPFTYDAKGKRVSMSYWQVPAEVLEDQEKLCEWARKAYDVAMSSKKIKTALKEMENDKGIPAKKAFQKLRKKNH